MNILLLAPHPFFQNRGTPIAVKLLTEVLVNEGNRIHMVTYHEGEDVDIQNLTIDRIPFFPGMKNIRPGFSYKKILSDVIMFFYCLVILSKKKFDVIHAVEESAFMAFVFKIFFNIPYIYDMDSCLSDQIVDKYSRLGKFKKMLEFFERLAVKSSLGVIAVCLSLEKFSKRCSSVTPVLRLEDISLLEDSIQEGDNLREMLGMQGPVIMYVGNLEKYQGVDLLIQGFQLTVAQCPQVHLVVIGGNPDHIQKYKRQAEQLKIGNAVHFIGPRPIGHLYFYLKQADILVSPRIQGENTPMKIYSYLDSGRPLVATRLSTHTQVLDDAISVLTEPNPKALADGFISLITQPELGVKIVEKAAERVRNEYCYDAFYRKLSKFYKRVASELRIFKKREA